MTVLPTLSLEGLAFWSPAAPGWAKARTALRDDTGPLPPAGARRPSTDLLPPAERRRAPETVALALEVAARAVADAGADAATLPSVFVSANGDLAINDAMCSTLATEPLLLSPTKFHHSVHNAAAGYWTIATGCTAASSAATAFGHSFAAGLLEAAALCAADATPVLLVAYDVAAVGALASVTRSEGALAIGLVLSPLPGTTGRPRLRLSVAEGMPPAAVLRSALARALAGNAMADALALMQALARDEHGPVQLGLSRALMLKIEVMR